MRFPSASLVPEGIMTTDPTSEETESCIQSLVEDDLLQIIFEFYGGNAYLFLAPVCQQWRDVYEVTFQQRTTWYQHPNLRISMIAESLQSKYNNCGAAVFRGDLAMVQWFHARTTSFRYIPWIDGKSLQQYLCEVAAVQGHLKLLKWARANGYSWGERTCAMAAQCNRLDLLQGIRASGCPWNELTVNLAVACGHLDILKWAISNGCPHCPFEEIPIRAAMKGQLEVVKWATANFGPWHAAICIAICIAAANEGHLEILQWARTNGFAWDIDDCIDAAREHPVTLQWLRSQQE